MISNIQKILAVVLYLVLLLVKCRYYSDIWNLKKIQTVNLLFNIIMRNINEYNLIILLSFTVLLFNCSNRDSLYIDLPDNKKLEDTTAGWWIREIGLSSKSNSKKLSYKIHNQLVNKAKLLDKYELEDKGIRFIWEYPGRNKIILIKEDIYVDNYHGDEIIWIHFEYPPPGIHWKEILPNDYMSIKKNRKLEHAATINSTHENARLFLFGGNEYCQSISLL